jgi:hypothetical protein
MRLLPRHPALYLVLCIAITACSKKEDAPAMFNAVVQNAPAVNAPPPAPQVLSSGSVPVEAQLSSRALSANDGERKFIRTAQVNFRVNDVYASALGIEDTVASFGGFVELNEIGSTVQNTQRHPLGDGKVMELTENIVRGHLRLRVPSHKTQEFLRAIVGHVVFLNERKFEAHDAQFDMMRKLLEYVRNNDAQDELGQASKDGGKLGQKAAAIASRNEAKAARDEALIQKKEFEDQVAFSTIDLTIYQAPKVEKIELTDVDAVFYQNRPNLGSRTIHALRSGWDGLLDTLVACIGLWPLWIVIAALTLLVRRFRKRRAIAATMKENR